jgi:hypothetical protein
MLAGVHGRPALRSMASYAEDSEYADMGPSVLETAVQVAPGTYPRTRRALRRLRDWLRSHYGLREIILPEKYRVDERNEVVVTYSSCLAHVYFADDARALDRADVLADPRRAALHAGLLGHDGIGLIATRDGGAVHIESRTGRARLCDGAITILAGGDPLTIYGDDPRTRRAIEAMVAQPNGGDLVLFGAYDGYEIVSFDDQIGAHGCAGGDQLYPFIITPPSINLDGETLDDARDIHRVIMTR